MVPKDLHVFMSLFNSSLLHMYWTYSVLTSWKWWKLWMLFSRLGYKKGCGFQLECSFLFFIFLFPPPLSFLFPPPPTHPPTPFLPHSFSFLLLWGKEAALFSAALWRGPHGKELKPPASCQSGNKRPNQFGN